VNNLAYNNDEVVSTAKTFPILYEEDEIPDKGILFGRIGRPCEIGILAGELITF